MAPAHKTQKSGNSAAVPTEDSPRVGSPSSGRWDLRSSGAGAVGDPVAALLARAHHARMEVERIRREMRACVCQRELAADICQARSEPDPNELFSIGKPLFLDRAGYEYQFKPEDFTACWKATYVPEVCGDYGRIEQEAYWDHAGGNADDGENHHLLWCGPCQKRETIRKGLKPARRRLAGLKSAIWRAAKKCAEVLP